ncbi:helix-turn-helix transcriptional regulator [Kineococcus sp. SYSU DK004]|uniref:helix-turn-helix transcriptional regulator n=1 Tax=Kineococcus sp. SYSU DK004 TaxID=3383125 RepID=UPI003D7C5C27
MSGARLATDLGLELLEVDDPSTQVHAGLRAMLRVAPGDVAAEVRVSATGRGADVTEAPDALFSQDRAAVDVVLRGNPGIAYLVGNGELPASRVEDICTPEEWAVNPMRRELLEPRGVPFALLAAQFSPAGDVLGWGVNRSRPFSDDERAALRALVPFLRRAALDRERDALLLDLDRAVAAGCGLLVFRGAALAYANAEASTLLDRHGTTPAQVLAVARRHLSAAQRTGSLPTRRGALSLGWRPALQDSTSVVVDEVAGAARSSPGGEDARGLVPRQHEILCHLAQGWTAAAIGRRLGISERTVHKHLQHLYRALGVGDRLNAVIKGRELGLLPVLADCAALSDAYRRDGSR